MPDPGSIQAVDLDRLANLVRKPIVFSSYPATVKAMLIPFA